MTRAEFDAIMQAFEDAAEWLISYRDAGTVGARWLRDGWQRRVQDATDTLAVALEVDDPTPDGGR